MSVIHSCTGRVFTSGADGSVTQRELRAKVAFSYIANSDDELTLTPGEVSDLHFPTSHK